MANYTSIEIRAKVTSGRPYNRILSEYNIPSADIDNDKNIISFRIFGKRSERLTPPQNGDLWVLMDDSGYCVTNDKKGEFFKYFIKTEDNELCLNEEQTVSLLKERISEMVVPVTKIDLLNMALSRTAKPGSNLEDINDFLDSMIEDDLDTRGIEYISKINIAKWKKRKSD